MIALPTHLVQSIDFIKDKKEITSIIQCGKNMTSWAEYKNGLFTPNNSGITKDRKYEGINYCGETDDLGDLAVEDVAMNTIRATIICLNNINKVIIDCIIDTSFKTRIYINGILRYQYIKV